MAEENTTVTINNVEYLAVSLVDLSLTAQVQQETVEEGFPVTDEIKIQPASFRLTLRLFKQWSPDSQSVVSTRQEQYDDLLGLYQNKRLFRFECDFGVYENAVIASMNPSATSGSLNTYDVSLAIREIVFARLLPATFQYLEDADGAIIDITPSDSQFTEVALTRPEANPIGEDMSILEQIIDWFAGWWPWS